jgi:hypothetical protein
VEERMVQVGSLEILLPDFATGESVVVDEPGLTSLVVVLGPAVLSVWHADGQLDRREPFLARLHHERRPMVLGRIRFDMIDMHGTTPTFTEYTAGVTDLFGGFVCVAWGYRVAPSDKEVIETLIDAMVQGMIVRRQRSLGPGLLKHGWLGKTPLPPHRIQERDPAVHDRRQSPGGSCGDRTSGGSGSWVEQPELPRSR